MPPVISQSRAGVLRHPECWTVEIKGHSPATNVLGKRGSYERTGFASHPSMGEERSGVMAKRNGCFPVLVARYCVPSAVRNTPGGVAAEQALLDSVGAGAGGVLNRDSGGTARDYGGNDRKEGKDIGTKARRRKTSPSSPRSPRAKAQGAPQGATTAPLFPAPRAAAAATRSGVDADADELGAVGCSFFACARKPVRDLKRGHWPDVVFSVAADGTLNEATTCRWSGRGPRVVPGDELLETAEHRLQWLRGVNVWYVNALYKSMRGEPTLVGGVTQGREGRREKDGEFLADVEKRFGIQSKVGNRVYEGGAGGGVTPAVLTLPEQCDNGGSYPLIRRGVGEGGREESVFVHCSAAKKPARSRSRRTTSSLSPPCAQARVPAQKMRVRARVRGGARAQR